MRASTVQGFVAQAVLGLLPLLAPAAEPPYALVWADEFNVDGSVNAADWIFERGFERNRELQWYQPDNASCRDGVLTIEARRERRPNPRFREGSSDWRDQRPFVEYTSSSIKTRGRHEWLYGRFEMRARIDVRDGSWPAFWALGTKGRWPATGEIDMMEYYRGQLLFNFAWARAADSKPEWNSAIRRLPTFGPTWAAEFHVWRMDWDERAIRLFLDGQLMNEQDISGPLRNAPAGHNPFHSPMYLLLNLAIGGDNGGDPTKTEFPVRFEVDYVRVYQRTSAPVRDTPSPR